MMIVDDLVLDGGEASVVSWLPGNCCRTVVTGEAIIDGRFEDGLGPMGSFSVAFSGDVK
jgi:hypothetical protein